ncbi:heparan-alpha-glucosaminide N-acetyltransferase [Methanoregula sp.]|uniref:heparan-alpha-glucosaminide N-acetyltransferase n=1 Tax=Methanoregula sp. TaxID=2052170 RepID=UPI002D179728|nr:heparan-alpha-glucosaminide N-acetyltransferase [Methanoregula sp.]HVP96598.1 heparan-alpha-glucosaminide N-acetyltransferase [Methanoregula sp.]
MSGPARYPEIDILRGIAILMMILFHTLFDLAFFRIAPIDVSEGFWRYFAYATATLFLLIVGVSLSVSHARALRKIQGRALVQKFLLRGGGIFCCGLLVTVATWWYLQEGYVIFGILHLIGISVMLSPLFFRFRTGNAVIGILFIVIGWILAAVPGPMALLVFGIHPLTFVSVDYTPIFPWMGVVLIGLAIGEYAYPRGERRWVVPRLPPIAETPLSFLGRHSLVIYLVHQPVILLILYLVTGAPVL